MNGFLNTIGLYTRYTKLGLNIDKTLSKKDWYPQIIPDDNASVIPDRGDRASYQLGEKVFCWIPEPMHKQLEVRRNGVSSQLVLLTEADSLYVLDNLPYGNYEIKVNDFVSQFEVIDYDVDCMANSEDIILTYNSKNAIPVCARIEDKYGNLLIDNIDLSMNPHTIKLKYRNQKSFYYKIIFEGDYGRICSPSVLIEK